jgi:hypothetical protein
VRAPGSVEPAGGIVSEADVARPTRWRTRGTSARLRVDLTGTVAPTPGGSHVRIAAVLNPAPHLRPLAPCPRAAMRQSWDHHLGTVRGGLESRSTP